MNNLNLKEIKCVIFDFDETLYSGADWTGAEEFFVKTLVQLGYFENVKIAVEEVKGMFPETANFNKKVVKFFIEKGLSPKLYKDMLENDVFDIKSESLRKMDYSLLDVIAKYYKLYLVSDSPMIYINHYLDAFGINKNNFEKIISNPFLKEDISKTPCMKMVMEHSNLNCNEILMIGDDLELDVLPAKELGFCAIHVKGVEETESLVKKLIELKK